MSLVESPWLLLVLPFVARRFVREAPGEDRWSTSIDLGLAAICGLCLAIAGGVWLAGLHLDGWPVTAPEFTSYCQSVASLQRGTLAYFDPTLSVPAAVPAGLLSGSLGIVGGLMVASLASVGVLGAALYLWGRAAHGRVAGVAAVILTGAVGPLLVLGRTLTFAPEALAAWALCGATALLAWRYRTLPALAAGGAGAGLLFVVDPHALPYALAGLALVCVAAVPRWLGHLPRRLLVVTLPFGLAWGCVAWTGGAAGGVATLHPGALPAGGMVASLAAPSGALHLTPWVGPLVVALTLWGLAMRRRPWELVGFCLSLLPFVIPFVRGLAQPLDPPGLAAASLLLPIALGASLGAFVGAPAPPRVAIPLLVLLLLLVVGVVPGWLSPSAGWRAPIAAERGVEAYQMARVPLSAGTAHCVMALTRDARLGRTWDVIRYPAARPEPLP